MFIFLIPAIVCILLCINYIKQCNVLLPPLACQELMFSFLCVCFPPPPGLVSHSDLDDRAIEALKEFNEEGALQVLLQFKDSDLSHVQVCTSWRLIGWLNDLLCTSSYPHIACRIVFETTKCYVITSWLHSNSFEPLLVLFVGCWITTANPHFIGNPFFVCFRQITSCCLRCHSVSTILIVESWFSVFPWQNKSAFLCGVMKTYRQREKQGTKVSDSTKGPDEAKIKVRSICNAYKYNGSVRF